MAYQARRMFCANLRKADTFGTMRFNAVVGFVTSANRLTSKLYQVSSQQNVQDDLDPTGISEPIDHSALTSVECNSTLQEPAVYNVQGVQGELNPGADVNPTRSMNNLNIAIENSKLTLAERRDMVSQGVQSDLYAPRRISTYNGGDPRLEVLAGNSGVSLCSVMQSNVPEPFSPSQRGTPTHVNMPGGGNKMQDKYTYGGVQSCHPSRRYSVLATSNNGTDIEKLLSSIDRPDAVISLSRQAHSKGDSESEVSTSQTKTEPPQSEVSLGQKERLKRAVKDYGATVVVFHVSISLMSLGACYLAVSSDMVDLIGLLARLGVGQDILESRLAAGATTFAISYAVHKVFAPVRIAMTLTCTPFIVRYLRRVGFLKVPKT